MAYRPPSWRNKETLRRNEEENLRNYLECFICTSQFEISCLNIEKETYDRFTPEEKRKWTCEHCTAKHAKWKPETFRSTVRSARLSQRTTSQPKLDNSTIHDDEETNTTVGTNTQKSEISRASYSVRPTIRSSQRTTSQPRLDNSVTQDDDETNMTVRTIPVNVNTNVAVQQPKNVDTETALLIEIRMLRGELQEINAKISSQSEYVERKFIEFERRLIEKDDETLILRHSLIEHQNTVNSSVQPIKYFLFLMVLLYLVTLLHSKRS